MSRTVRIGLVALALAGPRLLQAVAPDLHETLTPGFYILAALAVLWMVVAYEPARMFAATVAVAVGLVALSVAVIGWSSPESWWVAGGGAVVALFGTAVIWWTRAEDPIAARPEGDLTAHESF